MKRQLSTNNRSVQNATGRLNRRQFLDGALSVAASASALATLSNLAAEDPPQESKPVAVDVPGALEILATGKRATERKQCFLVDYQIPTDPHNNRQITEGHFENTTVPRAVDGALTTILSREATMRRIQLTMDGLIQENRRLEPNLKGLKT